MWKEKFINDSCDTIINCIIDVLDHCGVGPTTAATLRCKFVEKSKSMIIFEIFEIFEVKIYKIQ